MTEDLVDTIRALDPSTAQLALVHLVAKLRAGLDDDAQQAVQNESDARELLRVVAQQMGVDAGGTDISPDDMVTDLLVYVADDPATRDQVREIVRNPPSNRQMTVGALVGDPLVMGAIVTLLQTRFSIRVKSQGGKRSYDVSLGKAAADSSVIGAVLRRFGHGGA